MAGPSKFAVAEHRHIETGGTTYSVAYRRFSPAFRTERKIIARGLSYNEAIKCRLAVALGAARYIVKQQ